MRGPRPIWCCLSHCWMGPFESVAVCCFVMRCASSSDSYSPFLTPLVHLEVHQCYLSSFTIQTSSSYSINRTIWRRFRELTSCGLRLSSSSPMLYSIIASTMGWYWESRDYYLRSSMSVSLRLSSQFVQWLLSQVWSSFISYWGL